MIVETSTPPWSSPVHVRYRTEPEPESGYDTLTEGRIEHHLAVLAFTLRSTSLGSSPPARSSCTGTRPTAT